VCVHGGSTLEAYHSARTKGRATDARIALSPRTAEAPWECARIQSDTRTRLPHGEIAHPCPHFMPSRVRTTVLYPSRLSSSPQPFPQHSLKGTRAFSRSETQTLGTVTAHPGLLSFFLLLRFWYCCCFLLFLAESS